MSRLRAEAAGYPADAIPREQQSELAELLDRELAAFSEQLAAMQPRADALPPKALIDEAIVRLLGGGRRRWRNRWHFIAAGRRAMRCVWIDHLRRTGRRKRGRRDGADALKYATVASRGGLIDRVVVAEALERLATFDPLVARAIGLYALDGLSWREIARTLELSRLTLRQRWRRAIAVLRAELRDEWIRASKPRPASCVSRGADEPDVE
jgi:DNA-directed RNA polymerase specialized sigma24 family protein